MELCLICIKSTSNNTKSVEDNIKNIKIHNILYDLNYRYPKKDECLTNKLCVECVTNLTQLYNFRDVCSKLFTKKTTSGDLICSICLKKGVLNTLSNTVSINNVSLSLFEVLNTICSYNLLTKFGNICSDCNKSLITNYEFHLKCDKSVEFWTDYNMEHYEIPKNVQTSLHFQYEVFQQNCKLKKLLNEPKTNEIQCEICLKSFRAGYFEHHKLIHVKTKLLECKYCLKLFSATADLDEHLKTHKNCTENPFKCDLCTKSFARMSKLKQHLLFHDKKRVKKPFTCEMCSKSFRHLQNLKKHLQIHGDLKQFPTKTSGNDQFGCKNHTNEKRFRCEMCPKSFKYSSGLKIHTRTHTGEKSYKCEMCSKTFKQANTLKKHLNTHNG